MKSLIAFMRLVLMDIGTLCGTSTTRDWQTISRRYEHEGLPFFTIALANFGKDFEKSLDQGFVGPAQFRSFTAGREALPYLFRGLLSLVFDRKTGRLLDEPSIDAIRSIRQFSLMCGKIGIECSQRRIDAAIRRYIECEQEVRASDARISAPMWEDYRRIGRLLWADMFSSLDNEIWANGVRPKHGPGATADRLRGNAKYDQLEWTQRLEQEFPAWNYLLPSYNFLEKLEDVRFLEPGAERPVRVITVPKTQKTPRIIAIEPTCMQYVQQGILELMKHEFRVDDKARNLVNFDFQDPNRRLAKQGSVDGTLATLDLSEASDRVSYQHVLELLRNHGPLRRAVDACRSRKADVPGYGVKRLAKFASMGSALCFPFEALVFTTIIFYGIEQRLSRRLTKSDIESYFGRVRVYGDDIIVPVDEVPFVTRALQDFGLVVNTDKSFWNGKFRESCGGDYYAGHDVTVARVRSLFPTSRRDVSQLISTVELRNQLFERGYMESVQYLDTMIERLIPFPVVGSRDSAVLGRLSWEPFQAQRLHPHLHIPLVKGMRVRTRIPEDILEDSGALMKFFLKRGDSPIFDEEHLRRAGRAEFVTLKLGWADPR